MQRFIDSLLYNTAFLVFSRAARLK